MFMWTLLACGQAFWAPACAQQSPDANSAGMGCPAWRCLICCPVKNGVLPFPAPPCPPATLQLMSVLQRMSLPRCSWRRALLDAHLMPLLALIRRVGRAVLLGPVASHCWHSFSAQMRAPV